MCRAWRTALPGATSRRRTHFLSSVNLLPFFIALSRPPTPARPRNLSPSLSLSHDLRLRSFFTPWEVTTKTTPQAARPPRRPPRTRKSDERARRVVPRHDRGESPCFTLSTTAGRAGQPSPSPTPFPRPRARVPTPCPRLPRHAAPTGHTASALGPAPSRHSFFRARIPFSMASLATRVAVALTTAADRYHVRMRIESMPTL